MWKVSLSSSYIAITFIARIDYSRRALAEIGPPERLPGCPPGPFPATESSSSPHDSVSQTGIFTVA